MSVTAPETNGAGRKLSTRPVSGESSFPPTISAPLCLVIAGTAGEDVESAADLLALAGLLCGLHVMQKEDSPVQHGSSSSLSEVMFSPEEIPCTGIEELDGVLVASDDGARELVCNSMFARLTEDCLVLADSNVLIPEVPCTVQRFPFRKVAGDKNAALAAVAQWLDMTGALPLEALWAALESKLGASEAAKIRSAFSKLF